VAKKGRPRKVEKRYDAQKSWEQRLQAAKKVRDHWKKLFRVDLARDYYDGKQNPGFPPDEWITINKVYTHLQATLPTLYNSDPHFYVKLRRSYKPDPMMIALYELKGKARASMLNYLKEELRLKEKVRLAIQDAMFAYGVIKVRYCVEEQENPDAGQPMLSDGQKPKPLLDDAGAPLVEPDTIPINERYEITRIHPDDFLWDEDSSTLEDTWKWVAQCVRMTKDKAMADPRYKSSVLKRMGKNEDSSNDEYRQRQERKKGNEAGMDPVTGKAEREDSDLITLWEIYNLERGTWLVLAEGADELVMEEKDLPPGVEDHAFSILRFTLRDDSPYPIPPVSQGLDAQKELNLNRSRLQTHRKRFNRKYEVNVSALEDPEVELSKLESGEDGTVIRVIAAGAVNPIKDAPLDQQGLIELGYLEKDIIELMGGSTAESKGVAGADSATQAAILDKRMEIREGSSMGQVIDFVKCIARKLDQLVQQHIDKETAVKVTGPGGEITWELIKAQDYDEIAGEYSYEVNVGSTIPRLPHTERASFMAVLQIFASAPHLMTSPRLVRQVLEMHHIENDALSEELVQLAQQMVQQMAQGGEGGGTGSIPNVTEQNPAAIMGGQVGGYQSLNQPGAGNDIGV
jgi:hypothetical protein